MSEPKAKASALQEVVSGVYRWQVSDDRIGGTESDAFALVQDGQITLVDPLPIDPEKLRKLGNVTAIVLTAGNHQRSAWRFRKEFGVKVYAPENAFGLEEKSDYTFSGGDLLPGGLTAFHAPGPVDSMHALWLERPPVVFMSDLLTNAEGEKVSFVPDEYQDAPRQTRASVRRILEDIPFETVCFSHGPPLTKGGRKAVREAVDRDAAQ